MYQDYPDLQDASSALYQQANAIYQQKRGLMGDHAFTQLDAIKTALLRASRTAPAAEASRRAQVDQAGGIAGTTHQPARRPGSKPVPLSKEEVALAARMGIKDPEGARQRLLERNAKGMSRVTPAISQALGNI